MTASPTPGWAIARAEHGVDGEVIAADRRFRELLRAEDDLAVVGRRWTTLVSDRSGEALRHAVHTLARDERWGGALEMLAEDSAQPLRIDAYPAYNAEQRMVVLRAVELTPRPSGVDPETRLAIMEATAALTEPRSAAFATLQELRHAVEFDWGVVLRFHEDGAAEVAAAYPSGMAGAAPGAVFRPDFPERILRESGEPSIAGDLASDRLAQSPLGRLVGFGMSSVIRIPLFSGGTVAGCLNLYAHPQAAFDALDGLALEQYVRPLGARIAQVAPTPATPAQAAPAQSAHAQSAHAQPAVAPPAATAPTTPGEPQIQGDITPRDTESQHIQPQHAQAGQAQADQAPPELPAATIVEPLAAEPTANAEPSTRDGLTQLGSLVSGVAHELNNPLTAILGYAQMLPTLAGEDASKAIRTIEQEAIRAGRIVRNLLYFARQHRPRVDEIDLGALLHRVIEVRRYHLAVDNVEVEEQVGELPMILGDQYQLEQVFLNLLNNAHQALRPGGGTITVAAELVAGHVRVAVSDTGPGIPEGLRTRIFEPFFTTREVGEGAGLGLSIAYGIVQEHDGRLWAEHAAGGGARFIVELPVQPAEHPAVSPRVTAPPSPPGARASSAVLVVDDEEPIRALLSEILSARGYTVVTAANVEQAQAELERHTIDMVICDVRMPGGSGYDFREYLIAERPELSAHFLFVTGDVERDRRGQPGASSSAGAVVERARFLEKPFTTAQLLAALAEISPVRAPDPIPGGATEG